MPKQDNLTEIYDELQNLDQSRRSRVIERMYENEEAFLKKLKQLFQDLEDLESEEDLKKMFLVFKALLNVSDMKLLETLLSEAYYQTTFGVLEYNTEISTKHEETKHRAFLKDKAKFKNFMLLTDSEVIDKIHLNYRLAYLKDTALATGLDEANIQTIANLMSSNNSDVIQNMLLSQENISQIFEKLKSDDIDIRTESINFLSEIFTISKNLQVQGRLNLLSSFKSIEEFNLSMLVRQWILLRNDLESKDETDRAKLDGADKLINNSLDILMSYLQSFPVTLTDLCNEKSGKESEQLLEALTKHMLNTSSQGIKLQIHELIKFLFESDSGVTSVFYEIGFKLFSENFSQDYKEKDAEWNESADFSRSLALEIICKAITEDNYNAKVYLERYTMFEAINKLSECKNKLLNIGIIKFYKALISCGFKPYVTHMIKYDRLDTVVGIYDQNVNKKNMIGSIILELYATIEKKSLFDLAKHLFDKHESCKPFLEKAAEQYQPKPAETPNRNPDYQIGTERDDLMFNGYEDSVEDEKANQEAFERSQNFIESDQDREAKLKKLSFFKNRTTEEESDPYPLIRTAEPVQDSSPKIVIENQIFSSIKTSEKSEDNPLYESGSKELIGADNFDSKPIEFTKAEDVLKDAPTLESEPVENSVTVTQENPVTVSRCSPKLDFWTFLKSVLQTVDNPDKPDEAKTSPKSLRKRDLKSDEKLSEENLGKVAQEEDKTSQNGIDISLTPEDM